MIYLKAFNNAVMNEVHRLDLILSDAAKSTFLANISHELRTPLHGILGSIEFLHDTAMDDFQSSMVISVETCGKTLLDTVNHVLDYTKIQNLSRSDRGAKGVIQNADHSNKPETSLTEDFDIATVVEEVVEAVYAGQVFRTANADALEGKTIIQTSASRAMQQRQERRANLAKGSNTQKSPICLTLNIDHHTDWKVRSQPGAVRRIVMNILGNALKYTSRGNINVALEVDRSRSQSSSNLHLMLQIADTGQGMRTDFLKNHAFTAFSQENSLATGTGLGLSIVRQIVDSLGGKIDMSSEKDIGTEVRIWLSLPKSRRELNTDSEYNAIPVMRELTRGREMCMLVPYGEKSTEDDLRSLIPMPTIESSMRNLLAQWFCMKVTSTKTLDGKTMDDKSPDFFIYPEPPPIDYLMDFHGTPNTAKEVPVIIVCTNAFEAASLRSNGIHQLTDIGKIIEIIPQPCGAQKLAKVLHRCIQRLEILEKDQSRKRSLQMVPLPISKDESRAKQDPPRQGDNSDQIDGRRQDEDGMPQKKLAPDPPRDRPTLPEPLRSTRKSSSKDKLRPQKPSTMTNGTSTENTEINGETSSLDGENILQLSETNRPRVLVVDDNHINLHLLVTFVRKSGHPYESASDGLKALEAYKKSVQEDGAGRYAFKYILMDISMPVMNGISATKEIRKFEKEVGVHKRATIIALTGMGSDVAEEKAREAGFDQFLSKPVKFKTLVKLLV
jgi:signal transduction histidine kinase/CheY-like chemotaxis protein